MSDPVPVVAAVVGSRWRPTARRQGGAAGVTVSLALVAASGAALLAVGPRVLGDVTFGSLGLEWTISAIFGLGVAAPTEQLINRRVNVAPGASTRGVLVGLLGGTALALAVVVVVFTGSAAQSRFGWLVPGACVAVLGWAWSALARGRLLGAGDLRGYAESQLIEALARATLLVAAAVVHSDRAQHVLLAAAVGAPLFAGAAWAAGHRHDVAEDAQGELPPGEREQLAFVLYALGYQACLNGPVLLLEWRAGAALPALTGAFVVANSYFRAATIITGGVLVQALTAMSMAWGRADTDGFGVALRRATRRAVLLAAATSALALLLSPLALPLLYGAHLGLPRSTYLALTVSTVLVVAVGTRATALLASGRSWHAVAGWMSGAGSLVLVSLLLPVHDGVILWALLVAPLVALVVVHRAVRQLRPAQPAGE
jgi:hypothetical protein